MTDPTLLSRRELFSRLFRPLDPRNYETRDPAPRNSETKVAIIQGRYCLAYQRSFCSVCHERCPESGAIAVENGLPRVVSDVCTGCGICHHVCPAPVNAVLVIPAGADPNRHHRQPR